MFPLNPWYHPENRPLLIWIVLMLATGAAWKIGRHDLGGSGITALLLGLAYLKGALVILDYMAIRHAPLVWRIIMFTWLTLVCALIGIAYWKGLSG